MIPVDESPGKCAVFVLGMHRSGTSLLAGCLQEGGWTTPEVSQWNFDNQRGNREPHALNRLLGRLLRRSGGSWLKPVSLVAWNETDIVERDQFLAALFERCRLPVLKDPSLLLTLPFWRDRLPCRPLFIGIVRHPLAVAASLQLRNGLSIADGCRLWSFHNRALLELWQTIPFPLLALDVPIGQLAGDIHDAARKLADQAGVPPPDLESMRRFIDADLLHHRVDDEGRDQPVEDAESESALTLFAQLRSCTPHPLAPAHRPGPSVPATRLDSGPIADANRAEALGRWAEACAHLRRALPDAPDPNGIRHRLVAALSCLGDRAAIESLAESNGAADPVLLCFAAIAALQQLDFAGADRWIAQFSAGAPDNADALNLEALSLGHRGDWPGFRDRAVRSLKTHVTPLFVAQSIVSFWPGFPGASSDPARESLVALVAVAPPEACAALWTMWAELCLARTAAADALEASNKALAARPGFLRALFVRGLAKSQQRDPAGLADLETASEANPGDFKTALAWCRWAVQLDALASAERALQRLESINGKDPETCRCAFEVSAARARLVVSSPQRPG